MAASASFPAPHPAAEGIAEQAPPAPPKSRALPAPSSSLPIIALPPPPSAPTHQTASPPQLSATPSPPSLRHQRRDPPGKHADLHAISLPPYYLLSTSVPLLPSRRYRSRSDRREHARWNRRRGGSLNFGDLGAAEGVVRGMRWRNRGAAEGWGGADRVLVGGIRRRRRGGARRGRIERRWRGEGGW
ncbi:hypothetical protein BCR35DRAFT_304183 [Leucosporidium creatinivorum]|uniref:Uncharacterized protein n=1 Tax=Leucosporidium creatinivorum TaxID=106004 RepID=A0A1Y2FBL1_9BASI|nr:hypothetical protein BCR35DRAFT_304183 [Leucosporidium creatinivorum]